MNVSVTYVHFLPLVDPPRIIIHPQDLKDAIAGESVTFTVQAIGTEPLSYLWELKTGNGGGCQSCIVGRIPGANSSTITIPSVQKLNEGSYRCTVSNCGGSETSKYAMLTVGELNCYN